MVFWANRFVDAFVFFVFCFLNPTAVQLLTGFVASRDLWLIGVKGASALSRSPSSFPVSFYCHLKNALNSQEWFCQDSQEKTQIASEHITHIARFRADWGTWGSRTEVLCTVKSTRLKNLHGFRSSPTVQEGSEHVLGIKYKSCHLQSCSHAIHYLYMLLRQKGKYYISCRKNSQELMNTWRQQTIWLGKLPKLA